MHIQAAIARPHTPQLEIVDCELDESPQATEALIVIDACGICHTDLAARDQHIRTPLPAVLGHEGVGTIIRVGTAVANFAAGDRVIVSFGACGECVSCRDHVPAYCRQLANFCLLGRRPNGSSPIAYAGEPITGHFFGQSTFATHAIVATRNLVRIDTELEPAIAAPLACGIQTGMSAVVHVLRAGPDAVLAVLGCGAVGLAAVMAANIMSCRAIVAVDRHPARLTLACELGATHVVDTRKDELRKTLRSMGGITHVLDTTGAPRLIEDAFAQLRPRGTLVCAGIAPPDASLTLNQNDLMLSGRSIRGTIEGDADPREFIPRMLAWHREGRLPLERLVTTYPFAAINDALADMQAARVIKPVLLMR